MKQIFLYQIISAGLFIFGCYGLLRNRNRWAVMVFLQLMLSGVILSLLATTKIWQAGQPAPELTIIFLFGVLAIEILLGIIFTFKVFLSDSTSNPEGKPR